MTGTELVSQFEALRPHLMAVAYRLTGTVADAEGIVQEAGCAGNPRTPEIDDLRAWLTTVASRLGLHRLRSAAHRRETYTGNWLPEPVVTGFRRLPIRCPPWWPTRTPGSRRWWCWSACRPISGSHFVLHDGFAVPFAEVAEVLGTNEPAHGSWRRARKAVAEAATAGA